MMGRRRTPLPWLLSLGLAGGCTEPEPARPAPPADLSTRSEPAPTKARCAPELALTRALEQASQVTDCGQLGSIGLASWEAAQACVVAARAAQRAFRVSYRVNTYDSLDGGGYAWAGPGHAPLSVRYSETPGRFSLVQAALWSWRCRDLEAVPDCQVTVGSLCLHCVDGRPEEICEFGH
jgi:hypothetical protein